MKLAPILVLCLAVSIHQSTAVPFSIGAISDGIRSAGSVAEGIAGAAGSVASGVAGTAGNIAAGIAQGVSGAAQGAIGTATGIAKGVIGVKAGIAAGIADKAGEVAQNIAEKVQGVQNKVLKNALQGAQSALQNIQDNARGALQAAEIAGKNAEEGLIEVEDKKTELIQQWSENAKAKLANASPETQEKGQQLIDGFADKSAEDIKQASDSVLETLEKLQEQANSTAAEYHEPMNKLIEQVGKCSNLKVTQIRELVKCGSAIREDLEALRSAPGALAAVKGKLVKAAGQSIIKDIRVRHALSKFRDQSKQVDAILDQLVAQDQKNQEQNPQEDPEEEDGDDQQEEQDQEEPAQENEDDEQADNEGDQEEEEAQE